MPPLSCSQRIVFQNLDTGEGGKTEDTNKLLLCRDLI